MVPPLYKFRSVDEHTLDSLRESYVFFSNPTTFNDPFEFRAFLDYSNTRKRRKDVEARLSKFHPELAYDKRRRMAAKMMVDDGFRKGLKNAEFLPEDDVRKVLMYCASNTRGSILLWSHYAKNHTGICIEINANEDSILKLARPIDYLEDYPVVDVFDWDGDAAKDNLLYRKSPEWKYEGEYRAFYGVGERGDRKHKVDSSVFVSITFGAKISDRAREQVIEATRPKLSHIKFEQARLGRRTFSVDFEDYRIAP